MAGSAEVVGLDEEGGFVMWVRVTREGAGMVFNGPGHRALPAAGEGDVIEVQGGPYGLSLLEAGLVVRADPSTPLRSAQDAPGITTQDAVGPTERKPAEPKSKKLTEIRKLRDLKE